MFVVYTLCRYIRFRVYLWCLSLDQRYSKCVADPKGVENVGQEPCHRKEKKI